MIRGVNKTIVEISDTGNDCFDRAILFVRPSSAVQEGELLKRRGREYLKSLRLRPWLCARGTWLSTLLRVGGGALLGAGATALFFLLTT